MRVDPLVGHSSPTCVVGTPVSFTFTPGSSSPTPVRYKYKVNDGRTKSVVAASGAARISLTPTGEPRSLRSLRLPRTAPSALEPPTSFLANAATPAAEKDLTGAGVPDLLAVGGTTGLAAGLWLARGTTNDREAANDRGATNDRGARNAGRVKIPARNIGTNGNGAAAPARPLTSTTHKLSPDTSPIPGSRTCWSTTHPATTPTRRNARRQRRRLRIEPDKREHCLAAPGTLTDMNGADPVQLVLCPLTLAGFLSYPCGGVALCLGVGIRMRVGWCIAPPGSACA
jgi:hypothetical protein